MLSWLEHIPVRERLRLACALVFWGATYLLFVTWNHLQTEVPLALWQSRRLVATLWGTILFFGYTWLADQVAGRSFRERTKILLVGALGCGVLMLLGRAASDHLIAVSLQEEPATWTRHLRFTLIWGGYFAGGALAFLNFAPRKTGKAQAVAELARDLPGNAPDTSPYPEALWVSRGRETVRVTMDAIDWIEAEGDYVRLHARTGGGLLRGTLTGLESKLDPSIFARVHRSAICRRSAIVAMLRKPSGAMAVRLENGAEVPVGRSYRDAVGELLGTAREVSSRVSA